MAATAVAPLSSAATPISRHSHWAAAAISWSSPARAIYRDRPPFILRRGGLFENFSTPRSIRCPIPGFPDFASSPLMPSPKPSPNKPPQLFVDDELSVEEVDAIWNVSISLRRLIEYTDDFQAALALFDYCTDGLATTPNAAQLRKWRKWRAATAGCLYGILAKQLKMFSNS